MAMERLASKRYVVTPPPLRSSIPKLTCRVQFKPLWKLIMVCVPKRTFFSPHICQQQWRQMFDSFDADRDGRIDASELSQALEHYKYASPLIS